jgi:murein endopeptidase
MSFCDEMTDAQRQYEADVRSGRVGDILSLVAFEMGRLDQAQCNPHDGFLAWGRPIIATEANRLRLRRPDRCVHFGTDSMVALLEWLGREVGSRFAGEDYRGVRVLVGDGRGGRKGHASHTSGLDVDLGFLHAKAGAASPAVFSRKGFDPELSWWFVKRIFENPYACVRSIYLDRRHIARLARAAGEDPDWQRFGPLIRHVPGHQNHFHVRIGEGPGAPGCGDTQAPLRADRPSGLVATERS